MFKKQWKCKDCGKKTNNIFKHTAKEMHPVYQNNKKQKINWNQIMNKIDVISYYASWILLIPLFVWLEELSERKK